MTDSVSSNPNWLHKGNNYFEAFYKGLGIMSENEWEDFMKTAQNPLPVAFRVTGFRSEAKTMLDIIEREYLSRVEIEKATSDGGSENTFCDFIRLPWYPGNLAFQLQMDRRTIRRTPVYQRFHEMLVSETEAGGISRQETVSMLPPLLLDVKPGHAVLDMCAAPGSKTAQLLEMLHADEQVAGSVLSKTRGFVIANDSDAKRCQLMVHQLKRLQSPLLSIVCHDASTFPSLKIISEDQLEMANSEEPTKTEPVIFDRVLCDVPCSGDGTVRKNPIIWKRWSLTQGANMHKLQTRILRRGLELLRSDGQGRLVYSTCSLNPAENEAVVASVLQAAGDSLCLVDISDSLPGLKTRPGLKTWRFVTQEGVWMSTPNDIPPVLRRSFPSGIFCPPDLDAKIADQLPRCIRILPHDNNTGGFFVAVFEKTGKLAWQRSHRPQKEQGEGVVIEKMEDDENLLLAKRPRVEIQAKNVARKARKPFQNEAPLVWLSDSSEDWKQILDFFKLESSGEVGSFIPADCLCSRTESGRRRVFFLASPRIRSIILQNEHLRPIAIGVRCFARSSSPNSPCDFRICQDCVYVIRPFIRDRIVELGSLKDATLLLTTENPFTNRLSTQTKNQLENIDIGTCVFRLAAEKVAEKAEESEKKSIKVDVSEGGFEVLLAGWRGRAASRCFVAKYERSHFLRLCGIHSEDRSGKFGLANGENSEEVVEGGGEKTENDDDNGKAEPVEECCDGDVVLEESIDGC